MEREMDVLAFWFGVRRGAIPGFRGSSRPGLLIADRSGMYSSARRCYIRKTRRHRFRALIKDLTPVVKAYRLLQKLGMKSWPEHDAGGSGKEITRWKHRVMDAYWHAAPEKRKAGAIERYFRARYQCGMVYPFMALGAAIMAGSVSWVMLFGKFEIGYDLVLVLVFFLLAWVLMVMTELFVTVRWSLSRSEIHDVLEFELAN